MALSSPGIGSNLDVAGIVSKLMQVEAQPLTTLATREAAYQAKLTAFGSIKGALSAFQTAVRGLIDPSKFLSLRASSSDSSVATASAASNAVAGSYALDLTKIAQSQKLVAAGQASTTTAIGVGSITIDFGTISGGTFTSYNPSTGTGGTYTGASFISNGDGSKSITIDSSNNSLSGIRDAINSAKIGVTATIVNDGGTSPYRLALSSDIAGKTNSLKVSVSGDAALSDLLANDPAGTQKLQETATSQNTELTVNGIFVSKANTNLTDVIEGVTLSALKIGTTTVTVAKDTSGVSAAVSAFAKAYNELNKTLRDSSAYDAKTKRAAILQGESAIKSIQSQIRGLMGKALSPGGTYTNLSQVGLTFQTDGSLVLDAAKLQSALNANSAAVASVFATTGSATDTLVSYASSTSKTKPGNYELSVTQLATNGNLVASALAGLTINAGSNDALSVTVDGVSTSITLDAKTYASATELAAEVQSKINGASAFSGAGISVVVTQAAGALTITSNRYGSASNVSVDGIGADNLLGAGRTGTVGLDTAGTLGGTTGTGSGQNLTGATGSDTDGLKLLISGGIAGNRGTILFSQGYAYQLDKLLDDLVSSTGTVSSRTDGINRSIKDIENRREVLNRRLGDIEARYRRQFTALDTLIASMTQTSNYLSQQLANLPKISG